MSSPLPEVRTVTRNTEDPGLRVTSEWTQVPHEVGPVCEKGAGEKGCAEACTVV